MNTLSPDAEPRAFAEAKGDVCPEAPIWPENIAFRSRGPPSAVKIRRLRLLRSCSLPHIRSQKFIQSPYTRSGSLQSNSIRNGSGGPFSAYPRTLPAGTTADRILRIIVRPVASRHHADSSEPGKSRPRCREHGRRALHFVELEKSARVLAPPAGRRKSPQAAGLISKEPEAPQ